MDQQTPVIKKMPRQLNKGKSQRGIKGKQSPCDALSITAG
jgi:hypothetical protein